MGNFDFWNFVRDKSRIYLRLVSECHWKFPDKSVLVKDKSATLPDIFQEKNNIQELPRI